MPKLTELQALYDCLALWRYLADNPVVKVSAKSATIQAVADLLTEEVTPPTLTTKSLALVLVRPGSRYHNNCPCCEYLAQQSTHCADGADCIINWSERNNSYGCLNRNSPYYVWHTSKSSKVKAQEARKIVKLVERALVALRKLNAKESTIAKKKAKAKHKAHLARRRLNYKLKKEALYNG